MAHPHIPLLLGLLAVTGCDRTDARLDDFFSLVVHDIALEVDDHGMASLVERPREYAAADVTIDDAVYTTVGLRLKGGAGSFVPLGGGEDEEPWGEEEERPDKQAFIVDLDRFEDHDHLGLEKLTLNSMIQDPSFTHEYLAYALWREGGVVASRTGYARVTLNGEEKGLYALVESTDNDVFLERHYGTDEGNLYEGVYGTDLTGESFWAYDQDNGDDTTLRDLAELVDALDAVGEDQDGYDVLATRFDMDEYLAFAATEIYLGHWDGYAASANNYKIHHHPDDDVWTFVPWGADQTFVPAFDRYGGVMTGPGPSWGGGGRVHRMCFASAACRLDLASAFTDLLARLEDMDLAGLADETRALVEADALDEALPWQGGPEEVLEGLDDYLDSRPDELATWLPCLEGGTVDLDGDGYDGCTEDCDDHDVQVHPGATEQCDFRDDDCNGVIDDPETCPRCLEEEGPDGRTFAWCIERLGWVEAEAMCDDRGQTLASIHDAETWEHLTWGLAGLIEAERYWIGLNDRESEADFAWTDGTEVDFTMWAGESPKPWGEDVDCVASHWWGWEDIGCDEALPFVCVAP